MSAIRVIVLTPKAADKWLKLVSLQIDKLQLLIKGKISLIDKLSRGLQRLSNLELSISFNIICSSLSFPVAKRNLQLLIFDIFSITFKNVLAGILLVGPEPPIPKRIFISFLFIWNFLIDSETKISSISTSGSSLTFKSNFSFKNFLGVSVIC